MKYPKRSQYKYAKSPYRVRNWPEYEAGLRRRADLTIWFSEDAIKTWCAPPSGEPGGQRVYANIAIETIPVAALERLVTEKGLTESSVLEKRKNAWVDVYRHTPHGQRVVLRDRS